MSRLGRRVTPSLLVLLVLSVFATVAGAEELRYRLTETQADLKVSVVDGERLWALPGGAVRSEPGRPQLPVRRLEFVIPEGMDVRSVRLVGGTSVPVGEVRGTRIAQPLLSGEGVEANALQSDATATGVWPAESARLVSDQFFHAYRIAGVEASLVTVDESGRLWMLEQPELVVELGPADPGFVVARRERELPAWKQTVDAALYERVVNPRDINRAGGPRWKKSSGGGPAASPAVAPSLNSSPVRHLILTTEEFRTEFQRLADYRTRTGLPSIVVTVNEAVANAKQGVDLAETLRDYVRDAYTRWGVDYLLIGGDTDFIPTRHVYSEFYPAAGFTEIPTDHYYAALDGDWNADGDGKFGEPFRNASDTGDFNDFEPELAVGRATVQSAAEAKAFVDKVLAYEMPLTTNWQNKVMLASEVLFPSNWTSPADPISIDGAAISETLVDSVFASCGDPSLNFEKYYQNYTAYPGSIDETDGSVIAALNSGTVGVFHHIGHGFYFNMSVGSGQLEIGDVDGLLNGPNYFLLYSLNCSSSAFDLGCLNEKFLRNPDGGSVVSIGSARAAFPTMASAFQEEFYRSWMCSGLDRVGDAFEAGRAPFIADTYFNTVERWTQFVYCLLGDPATRLWGATPQGAVLNLPSGYTLGDSQVVVNVTSSDGLATPLSGVEITASKGLEDYATAVTDGAGNATLSFRAETAGDIEVWACGGGVRPQSGLLPVVDGGSPIVAVKGTSLSDDGTAGSSGNGNGRAEAGEIVALGALFSNGGSVAIPSGGSAILSSVDPWISVVDSVVTLPSIGALSEAWGPTSWTVAVSPGAPDGYAGVLSVALTPIVGSSSTDYIAISLAAPQVEITQLVLDDSLTGNGNGIADVGEEFDLLFTLRNYGEGSASGLSATLSTTAGNVTVLDASSSWPDLPLSLNQADNVGDPFRVRLDALPDSVLLELTVLDGVGRSFVREFDLAAPSQVQNVFLAEGDPSRLRINWDPSPEADLLGYLVYRKGPGDVDFVQDSPDILSAGATWESTGLIPLSTYEFQVAAVDSAGLAGPLSAVLTTSTYPPEISCFPMPMGLETSGSLAVGTVDHDFIKELVVGSDFVYVVDGNCTEKVDGDGNSQTIGPVNSVVGDYGPAGIALGDLVRSEIGMEIVAVERNSRSLYVLNSRGDVMPGWPRTLKNWAWGTPVVGDLDNDGDLEIVVNDIGGYTYAFHHDGTEVADGDGDPLSIGPIAPQRSQDVGGTIYTEFFGRTTPAVFDVDGDGTLEILFGSKYQNINAPEFFYALKADGSGQNAAGWPKQFVPRSEFLASPTVADLDNDGIFEIIAISENDSLYVWDQYGNTRPGFPIVRQQDSSKMDSLCPSPGVGDFDEDGLLEIVFVSIQRITSVGRRSFLEIVDSDGVTLPGWPVEIVDLSEGSPVIGDLNGDGSLDIAYGVGGTNADDFLYGYDVNGVSLPGFPIPVGGFLRATPTIVDLNGDGNANIVLASWDSQIHAWDTLAPFDPARTPWSTFRGNVNRTGVYQQEIWTASPSARGVVEAQLGPALPNPFNPATELSFELPSESDDVRLTIYDSRGRKVRGLVAGQFPAGLHRSRWNGLDDQGRPVASGVYYAQLRVDGEAAGARKLALVK